MAASTYKVILFSRVTVDKKTHQWPTAVFNKHADAKTFATILSVAHKSGDVETAVKMDPRAAVDADGKLVPGLRFSIVEVPYAPTASFGTDDMFDAPDGVTS